MSKETDLAWLAGFFEGEGCISISKNERDIFQGHLTISQRNIQVLKNIEAVVTASSLPVPHRHKFGGSVHLLWYCFDAAEVLQLLLPYMHHPKYCELALLYLEIYKPEERPAQGTRTGSKRCEERCLVFKQWKHARAHWKQSQDYTDYEEW